MFEQPTANSLSKHSEHILYILYIFICIYTYILYIIIRFIIYIYYKLVLDSVYSLFHQNRVAHKYAVSGWGYTQFDNIIFMLCEWTSDKALHCCDDLTSKTLVSKHTFTA